MAGWKFETAIGIMANQAPDHHKEPARDARGAVTGEDNEQARSQNKATQNKSTVLTQRVQRLRPNETHCQSPKLVCHSASAATAAVSALRMRGPKETPCA